MKPGRVGGTVKVARDNLVLSLAQDALQGPLRCLLHYLIGVIILGRFLHVRSTMDTLGVETQKAMPVSFSFSSGVTLPTALAAPADAGMMFWAALQPSQLSRGAIYSLGWQ